MSLVSRLPTMLSTLVLILMLTLLSSTASAQAATAAGPVPVFDGWEAKPGDASRVILHFGYINSGAAVTIAKGGSNRLTPDGLAQSQPTYFFAGERFNVFIVEAPASGIAMWHLNGSNVRGSANKSYPVYVPRDKTAPAFTLPTNLVTEATSGAGALVSYTVTALDDVSGPTPVSCNPVSGSQMRVGLTSVTCTTTDEAGNVASVTFDMRVSDTTAPQLNIPQGLQLGTTEASIVGTYAATATDAVDAAPTVTCDPASGQLFKIGTATVACIATDAAGNMASGSFPVTVTFTGVKPALTNFSGASGTVYASAPATVAASFTVSGTPVPTVTCQVDQDAALPATDGYRDEYYYYGATSAGASKQCNLSGLSYGDHTLTVRATNAGGTAEVVTSFTVVAPSWIYYTDDQTSQVYRLGYETSATEQLTQGPGSKTMATPSPDRTRVAYNLLNWSTSPATFEVRVINANGTADHKVGDIGTSMTVRPSFSADGTQLVWYGISGGMYRVLTAPVDGSAPAKALTTLPAGIGQVSEMTPKFAVDGSVLFTGYMGTMGAGLFGVNADGSGLRKVSAAYSGSYGFVLARDGKSVYMLTSSSNLTRVDLATGQTTQLATGIADSRLTLSPDGTTIAFTQGNGYQYTMATVKTDGTGYRAITSVTYSSYAQWTGCFGNSWTADSKSIIGTCYFGGGIYIAKIDPAPATPVSQPPGIGGGFRSRYPMLAGFTT